MLVANILIVAATCHPDKGSEPGLGWNWIRHIASRHSVTAIVGESYGNREAIRIALDNDPVLSKNVKFIFVDWFPQPKKGLTAVIWRTFQPLYYRRYRQWMFKAYGVANELCTQQHFDFVHQITIASYREPGFAWKLPVPFIWGPVGGLGNMPWRCLPSLGPVEGVRHLCRNVLNIVQIQHHYRFHRAIKHASAIFAMDTSSQHALQKNYGKRSVVVAAAFCDRDHPAKRFRIRSAEPLRLLFAGLHLSRKGLAFLLQALALLPDKSAWQLDVLGHGVMTHSWKQLANRLGLEHRVTFHGYVANDEKDRIMQDSDVLVFPSLLEGWPAVVAEALSLGMPVVTTDLHGMRDVVTKECGILVDAKDSHLLIKGLRDGISRLISEKDLLGQLSAGAAKRATELSAEQQMPLVFAAYDSVLSAAAVADPKAGSGLLS